MTQNSSNQNTENLNPQVNPQEPKEVKERTDAQVYQRIIASRFRRNHVAKIIDSIDAITYEEAPHFTLKPQFTKQQLLDSIDWVGKVGEVVNEKIPAFGYLKLAFRMGTMSSGNGKQTELKFYPHTRKYAFQGQTPVLFDPETFDKHLATQIAMSSGFYNDATAIPVIL